MTTTSAALEATADEVFGSELDRVLGRVGHLGELLDVAIVVGQLGRRWIVATPTTERTVVLALVRIGQRAQAFDDARQESARP